MPHHEKPKKIVSEGDSRAIKSIKLPCGEEREFAIDSFSTTYKDVRSMFRLDNTIIFINRKGEELRDENSALGTKTKLIKTKLK